ALTALVDLVKSYNEHEYKPLRDVIAVRKGITATSSAEEVETQEKAIQNALAQINVVAEQYPDLKANENYREIMKSVNVYEDQVRLSRMVYNDTVTLYNGVVRMFPSSLVASMFGFAIKTYLEVAQQKTEMPSMKI
ncbi:MAG: LemA family protein, partial [Bacteroidales bacterium]|nr:LemA family protein [Bacteroidales bacterium]